MAAFVPRVASCKPSCSKPHAFKGSIAFDGLVSIIGTGGLVNTHPASQKVAQWPVVRGQGFLVSAD